MLRAPSLCAKEVGQSGGEKARVPTPYSLWRHGDYRIRMMERETGFEPATHCLGSNWVSRASQNAILSCRKSPIQATLRRSRRYTVRQREHIALNLPHSIARRS